MRRRICPTGSHVCALIIGLAACFAGSGVSHGQAGGQAEVDFAFAEGLYAQEFHELAAEKYVQFIERYPNHANMPLALFRAGECHFRLDKFAEAATHFEQVTKMFPKSEEAEPAWLWLGDSHYQAEQYEPAAAAYKALLDNFPKSEHAGRAAYWRGESYYNLGEYEQAIAAYESALHRKLGDQETAYALYSMGLSYLKLDKPAEAIKPLLKVVGEHGDSPVAAECQYLVGTAYHLQKDLSAAIAACEKVIAEHGNSKFAAHAQLRIGWCHFEQKDYEKALSAFTSVWSNYPNTSAAAEARLRAADSQFQLRRWDEAAGLYAKVAADKDGKWAAEALYWLGITHERKGEADKALKAYERVVKEHKDSLRVTDAYSHIGQLHVGSGKLDEAIAAYEAAANAAKKPERKREALAGLAWARYQKDKSGPSLAHLEKMLREDPKSHLAAELACQVARAYFDGGKHEAALGVLELFIANHPEHEGLTEALFLSGACHEKLGHTDEALKFYQMVLAQERPSGYRDHATAALVGLYAERGDLAKAREMAAGLEGTASGAEVTAFALYRVAQSLYEQKKYEEAATFYAKALNTDPEGETAPHAQMGLGWAKLAGGDPVGAAEAFGVVSEKHPDSPAAKTVPEGLLAAAEKLFEQEDYARAGALYRQIVDAFGDSDLVDEAQYKLGWIALKQGKKDEALGLFTQAATKANLPEVAADARYQAARLLDEKKDYKRVAELLEPFKQQYADFDKTPWALALLGRALTELGRQSEATLVFGMLSTTYQEHAAGAYGLLGLARDARQQNQPDKALEALARVIASGDEGLAPEAQYETAACHRAKGDLKTAAEEFLKVAILYNDDRWGPQAQYEAGQCFEALGDKAKAVKSYSAILKRYPEQEEWVEKAKARIAALEQ